MEASIFFDESNNVAVVENGEWVVDCMEGITVEEAREILEDDGYVLVSAGGLTLQDGAKELVIQYEK